MKGRRPNQLDDGTVMGGVSRIEVVSATQVIDLLQIDLRLGQESLPNSSYRYVIPYLTGNIQDDVRVVTLNDPYGI